jgi:hypothetical protein
MNDLIVCKEVKVEYCPRERMIGDYIKKPLTGTKLNAFHNGWSAGVSWRTGKDKSDK